MGFVLYRPPADFARSQNRDDAKKRRPISIKVESVEFPTATRTIAFDLVRPPVVLVHGLWGSFKDWGDFKPLVEDSRFTSKTVNYDRSLGSRITASNPVYSPATLQKGKYQRFGFRL